MNFRRIVIAFFWIIFGVTAVVPCQNKLERRDKGAGVVEMRTPFTLIPEATEPCTPEETQWWTQVRQAGNKLYKSSDEGSKKKFYLLLYEGQQKSYRVPLKDRGYQVLVQRPYDPGPKSGLKGTLEMSVEFRADASVGEVRVDKIDKGLSPKINEMVIQVVRQTVFLPAVKDGAFVSSWGKVKNVFN